MKHLRIFTRKIENFTTCKIIYNKACSTHNNLIYNNINKTQVIASKNIYNF